MGASECWIRPFVMGDIVRDWAVRRRTGGSLPVSIDAQIPPEAAHGVLAVVRTDSPYPTHLEVTGRRSAEIEARPWWEYGADPAGRFRTPSPSRSPPSRPTITSSSIAVRRLSIASAPVIKLPPGATEDDHLALLGLLNSSVACFWMKQVFYHKGVGRRPVKTQSDPRTTPTSSPPQAMQKFPIPRHWNESRWFDCCAVDSTA